MGTRAHPSRCMIVPLPAPARENGTVSWFLNEANLVVLEPQACQPARGVGAGVNIDPVWPHLRFPDRRVTVNDYFFERFFVQQEFVPYPEKVLFFLGRERRAGPHPGMH